jgi:hypothetical protein
MMGSASLVFRLRIDTGGNLEAQLYDKKIVSNA